MVCLDKFRGSLSAGAACDAVAKGIRSVSASLQAQVVPIADGGEGTVDVLVSAGYREYEVTVSNPLGQPVEARIAVCGEEAVIEMAQASGLHLIDKEPQPLIASSYGTGELVRAALDLGCRLLVLAVGGSATTDGGAGMLQALGVSLLTSDGAEIDPGGAALGSLARVRLDGLDSRLSVTDVVLATDVDNPLLGPAGAAAAFGPQKGADIAEVAALETAMRRYADILAGACGTDCREQPGAGAAGGIGFAALTVLGARRVAGIDLLIDRVGLATALAGAAAIVVGEGRLDEQSLNGKAPIGVARLARKLQIPAVAIAGQIKLSEGQLADAGIVAAYSVLARSPDVATSMSCAESVLRQIGADLGCALLGGTLHIRHEPN